MAMNTVSERARSANSPDQMIAEAMSAEARAKAVWSDASATAQEKAEAVWMAVAARQQSDDAERPFLSVRKD